MNKKGIVSLVLLSSGLLLASCSSSSASSKTSTSASSSSSSDSSSSTASSSSTSTSSSDSSVASSVSSSSASSVDTEALKSEYGTFSLTQTKNGAEPVFDSASNTYTLAVSAKKATYTLKGYFAGTIVIANPSSLSDYKGVNLVFNQACLVSDGSTPVISYTLDSKALTLSPNEDTTNMILALGSADAVESEHTAEMASSGTLAIQALTGNAISAHDIRLYDNPIVKIEAGADGLHGHAIYCQDEDYGATASSTFSGSLAFKNIGNRALDATDGSGTEDDPYVGFIDIGEGATVTIDKAVSVARTDTFLHVEGSLIATNITGTPLVSKNTGACDIASTGTFMINGEAVNNQTI